MNLKKKKSTTTTPAKKVGKKSGFCLETNFIRFRRRARNIVGFHPPSTSFTYFCWYCCVFSTPLRMIAFTGHVLKHRQHSVHWS